MPNTSLVSVRMRWREVAAMLGCSRSFLYQLHKAGKLPMHHEGLRFTFWLRPEVEAYAMGKPVAGNGGEASCQA